MPGQATLTSAMRLIGIALALVALLATAALAAPPPGRGGPPDGAGPPEGRGPDRPTPVSPVAVSVADGSATEGSPVEFTISLDQAANADVTVQYETSDGTALAGTHYTTTSGQAIVASGTQSTTVDVLTADDGDDNLDRTFTLSLTAVSNNGTLADDSAIGTIEDDDDPPVGGIPTLAVGDVAVSEGGTASFPVTLSPASTGDVVVTYTTTDGTAEATVDAPAVEAPDYTAAVDETITILAGQTTGTIEVATLDDLALDPQGVDEPDETFTVTVTAVTGDAVIGDGTGQATILDDDDPPVLRLLSRQVEEDTGTTVAVIDLFGRSSEPTTLDFVAFTATGDTATENVDYTPVTTATSVTIPAGATTGTVGPITLLDDSEIEPDETFTVEISNVSANASIDPAQDIATVTIADDDGTTECSTLDTHEDTNDTSAGARQIPLRDEFFVGESSWACQGDVDWWAVDLFSPAVDQEFEITILGENLGDVVVHANFVSADGLTTTPMTVSALPDGLVTHYVSDGTHGRILVDTTLPGDDPELGVQYAIGYRDPFMHED